MRFLPAPVTPVELSDVAASAVDHVRGDGREELRKRMLDVFGANDVVTYPSFRGTIAATLLQRHDGNDDLRGVVLPAFSCPDFFDAIEVAPVELHPEALTIDVDAVPRDRLGGCFAWRASTTSGSRTRCPTPGRSVTSTTC